MDILKGKCMPYFQAHKGKAKKTLPASVDSQSLSAQSNPNAKVAYWGMTYSDPRHLTDE